MHVNPLKLSDRELITEFGARFMDLGKLFAATTAAKAASAPEAAIRALDQRRESVEGVAHELSTELNRRLALVPKK